MVAYRVCWKRHVRHDGAQQRRRTSMDYLGLGLTLGNATLRPCMRLQTTQHQRRRETSCMVSLKYVHPPSGVLVPLVSIEAHPACHASSAAATFLDGDFPEHTDVQQPQSPRLPRALCRSRIAMRVEASVRTVPSSKSSPTVTLMSLSTRQSQTWARCVTA